MKETQQFKFQIKIDTDSILISQAPNKTKSRVILANLEEEQLHQLAKSIIDADLKEVFIKALREEKLLV